MKPRIIILYILSLALWGCEKKDIDLFATNDTGIYFQPVSSYTYGTTTEFYNDSIAYSFASENASVESSVLRATVRTMGKVADYNRPFKVIVDPEGTTAIEGVHYEVNLDTCYVPAGESTAYVRVRFFRTSDLLTGRVRLQLRLQDNEYFTCYFNEYKNTNSYTATGTQISGVTYVFSVSEEYEEPSYWNWFGIEFFGDWTPQKFLVVNSVCELTVEDWDNAGYSGAKISYGRFGFFALAVQNYLQEQANAGTPVLDTDGSYMQLAAAYSVDYSAYE